MAGAMRKVGEYLGLVEQDLDGWAEDDELVEPAPKERSRRPERVAAAPAPVATLDERRPARREPRPTAPAPSVPRVAEVADSSPLLRIETVTPRTYNDARSVGEH